MWTQNNPELLRLQQKIGMGVPGFDRSKLNTIQHDPEFRDSPHLWSMLTAHALGLEMTHPNLLVAFETFNHLKPEFEKRLGPGEHIMDHPEVVADVIITYQEQQQGCPHGGHSSTGKDNKNTYYSA